MNTPPEPVLTEAGLILVLLAGMALLALTCVLALLPPALRLLRAKRAHEAAEDARVFDGPTPIYDQLAANYDDFEQWDAEFRTRGDAS
jgi:hypothetical protein